MNAERAKIFDPREVERPYSYDFIFHDFFDAVLVDNVFLMARLPGDEYKTYRYWVRVMFVCDKQIPVIREKVNRYPRLYRRGT